METLAIASLLVAVPAVLTQVTLLASRFEVGEDS